MYNGFVKFERKIADWGWYKDVNTFKLFFHLILFANFTDGEFMGIPIKKGQIARSYKELSTQTGLTEKEIRTALKHLINTGEVAEERHQKFKVYTIKNYSLYQSKGSQRAVEGQSRGSRGAVEGQQYKNDKKYKNDNNVNNYNARTHARERKNCVPTPKSTKFNNFTPSVDIDYEDLEKRALQKQLERTKKDEQVQKQKV